MNTATKSWTADVLVFVHSSIHLYWHMLWPPHNLEGDITQRVGVLSCVHSCSPTSVELSLDPISPIIENLTSFQVDICHVSHLGSSSIFRNSRQDRRNRRLRYNRFLNNCVLASSTPAPAGLEISKILNPICCAHRRSACPSIARLMHADKTSFIHVRTVCSSSAWLSYRMP